MRVVKANSSLGKKLIAKSYQRAGYRLSDIYDKYSEKKVNAWNNCFRQYIEDNGTNFKINSYNCNFFSVSWLRPDGSLRYETAYNSYLVVA